MSDLFAQGMKNVTEESIAASNSFGVVPTGDYNIQCEKAGMEQTNSGKNYFGMTFTITGPTMVGRKIFQKYWIESENKKYVAQCFDRIADFAIKAGIDKSEVQGLQPADFVGLKAAAKIKHVKDENYGDSNEISHYKKPINEIPSSSVATKDFAADDVPF